MYTYREGEIPDSRVSPRNRERLDRVGGEGAIYIRRRVVTRGEREGRFSRSREVSRAKKDPGSFEANSYGLIDIVRRFHVAASINVSRKREGVEIRSGSVASNLNV